MTMRVKCMETYKNGQILGAMTLVQGKEYELTEDQFGKIKRDNPHAISPPLPSDEFMASVGARRVTLDQETVMEVKEKPEPDELVEAFGEKIAEVLHEGGLNTITEVAVAIDENKLENIPGIGSSRANDIYAYFVEQADD